MKFAEKVAMAVDISVEAPGEFSIIKELDFLRSSEIHLVYVFQTTTYTFGFALSETALIYPILDERKKIEASIIGVLKKITEANIPKDFTGKITYECLFSDTPKKAFCDYVEKNNISLVFVSSREKRGLFESSFAQYVAGHTKANMIILKHKM
jgi:nucleotide-binding universal stress UspA family protein